MLWPARLGLVWRQIVPHDRIEVLDRERRCLRSCQNFVQRLGLVIPHIAPDVDAASAWLRAPESVDVAAEPDIDTNLGEGVGP